MPIKPNISRFWAKVEKTPTCWLWTGSKNSAGYGTLKYDNVYWLAHRLSYFLATGAPIDGLQLMHSCDTPLCVNPQHLSICTPQENISDMHRKGRGRAKLTAAAVRRIREASPQQLPALAVHYGMHITQIRRAYYGQSWGALEGNVPPPRVYVYEQSHAAKFTANDIREIRQSQESLAVLAQRYGVSKSTICNIRLRKRWKHIA